MYTYSVFRHYVYAVRTRTGLSQTCSLPSPPPLCAELSLAFTDGDGMWDNAGGADYSCPVLPPGEAGSQPTAARPIAQRETHSLAGGTLHILMQS